MPECPALLPELLSSMNKLFHCIRVLLIALALGGVLAIAQAPQGTLDPSTAQAAPTLNADKTPELTLPPAAIISILQARPEVMIDVKRLAAQSAQSQGVPVRDDSITDEMVFLRINSDAEFRKAITSWLWTRGYVTQDDLERANFPADDSDQDSENQIAPASSGQFGAMQSLSQIPGVAGRNGIPSITQQLPPATMARTPDKKSETEDRQRKRNEKEAQGDPNQPPQDGLIHQPTPLNLLALRDLYTQVPEQTTSLRRFGSDAFLHHGLKPAELPTDLPVGPEYVLGPGDSISMSLWGSLSQTVIRIVDHEGRITLPEAGPVMVSGLTLAQAQSLAEKTLRPQFRDIHVQLSLARVRTVRIYVVGDVQRPGAYDVSSLSTALNALYAAGGPTAIGSLRTILHYRNRELVREIDLYDFLLHGLRADPELLQPGDTILVPPAGKQVTVAGMIRRPAIYELRGEQTLDDVIGMAGGLLVAASTAHIKIDRIQPHSARVTEDVPLGDPADMAKMREKLKAFAVADGDRIVVAPVLPYSERAVYVEGHVIRPGKFPYHDDMSLTDVLHSYADLLPEPADRGEIVRLRPPDFRPETVDFSVSEAMIGNARIQLQPFDTIRILGRYELDAPTVTIQGEVLRPGSYPLAEKLSAAQLVRLAGGFKRSALLDHADLTSYVVQKGTTIAIHRASIDIGRAVDAADTAADVELKPGDVLTVHQISGWNDIGASVTLNGEVVYPGSYGIQDGERLSSVLKRAGGLRTTAYAAGAVLTRIQVREFQEKSREELVRQIETTSAATKLSPSLTGSDQTATLQLIVQQQQQVLQRLKTQPSSGRMVIKISPDIASWENTPADIELRSGDVLEVPKRPGFVLVTGQVYNSAAITYTPGKNAIWYLRRAGGPTEMASKKQIFIIRANGSVIGRDSSEWFGDDVLRTKLNPGDVVVVPQKFIGGSVFWRNLLATAQFMASFAITAKVAGF
jgi:protein involved in polysaccharide export with SLBB domain